MVVWRKLLKVVGVQVGDWDTGTEAMYLGFTGRDLGMCKGQCSYSWLFPCQRECRGGHERE